MRRTTGAGTVGLCLAALVLLGCGTQRADGGTAPGAGSDGSGGPPTLLIGNGALVSGALGATAGPPRLRTTLPEGPASAPVHRYDGAVPGEAVTRLALALGLDGPAEQHAYGSSVGTAGGPQLTVRSDGTGAWTFVSGRDRCAPLVDVDRADDGDATTSCTLAEDTPGPAPGEDDALAAAAPVLAAVGLDPRDPDLQVRRLGDATWVTLDPRLDGVRTVGVATTVAVDSRGVASASGHLRGTSVGAHYPLVSARQAWDRVADLPVPEIAIGCPAPGPESALPCPARQDEVTGVELGLALRTDPEGSLLVPAWLFTTTADGTVAIVAVQPRLLGDPPAAGRGDLDDGPTGSGVAPGSPGTGG